ncbi:MAG: hypothetical protein VZQ51_10200, partial [Bacteroidales bacterium]|nr:hypothetical protein [Bacteroidales bacterium]
MKLLKSTTVFAGAAAVFAATVFSTGAQNFQPSEYKLQVSDTGILSDKERAKSPIQLKDPAVITTETEYDYKSGGYTTKTKVGDMEISRPEFQSAKDHDSLESKKEMRGYWKQQMQENYSLDGKNQRSGLERYLNPRINVNMRGFDRIFGTNVIDIKPQGNVSVTFGADISKI